MGFWGFGDNLDTLYSTLKVLRRIENAARNTGAATLSVDLLEPLILGI